MSQEEEEGGGKKRGEELRRGGERAGDTPKPISRGKKKIPLDSGRVGAEELAPRGGPGCLRERRESNEKMSGRARTFSTGTRLPLRPPPPSQSPSLASSRPLPAQLRQRLPGWRLRHSSFPRRAFPVRWLGSRTPYPAVLSTGRRARRAQVVRAQSARTHVCQEGKGERYQSQSPASLPRRASLHPTTVLGCFSRRGSRSQGVPRARG